MTTFFIKANDDDDDVQYVVKKRLAGQVCLEETTICDQ